MASKIDDTEARITEYLQSKGITVETPQASREQQMESVLGKRRLCVIISLD